MVAKPKPASSNRGTSTLPKPLPWLAGTFFLSLPQISPALTPGSSTVLELAEKLRFSSSGAGLRAAGGGRSETLSRQPARGGGRGGGGAPGSGFRSRNWRYEGGYG